MPQPAVAAPRFVHRLGGIDPPKLKEGEFRSWTQVKTEHLMWFAKTQAGLNHRFKPYLQLNQDLPWYARLERDLNSLTARLDDLLKSLRGKA